MVEAAGVVVCSNIGSTHCGGANLTCNYFSELGSPVYSDSTGTHIQPEAHVRCICRSVVELIIAAKQCFSLCELASGECFFRDGHFHLRNSRNRPWRKLGISKGRHLKEYQVEKDTALMVAFILLSCMEVFRKGSRGNKKRIIHSEVQFP